MGASAEFFDPGDWFTTRRACDGVPASKLGQVLEIVGDACELRSQRLFVRFEAPIGPCEMWAADLDAIACGSDEPSTEE